MSFLDRINIDVYSILGISSDPARIQKSEWFVRSSLRIVRKHMVVMMNVMSKTLNCATGPDAGCGEGLDRNFIARCSLL